MEQMSLYWVLFIISVVIGLILFIISWILWKITTGEKGSKLLFTSIIIGIIAVIFLFVAIKQNIALKQIATRQEKEREQIEYQIENLTEDSDKIKLNEWVLTYNDWVNDVNTSKEVYGWFSWYYTFDMTNHTIIELV